MSEMITFSVIEVAERLGVSEGRVHQLLRDGELAALGPSGAPRIPADFLDGAHIVKGLAGALTLLRDAGFSHEEAVRWMFTPDESLPGTPIGALRANRGKEVRRRAQASAF